MGPGRAERARPGAMGESLVTWAFPTTIVFGVGRRAHASADHVKRLGAKRALVVCDAGVVKVGIAERVRGAARGGRRRGGGLRQGRPEPGREERRRRRRGVPRARRRAASSRVGGGSPLDAGKLIALKVTHERPLVDYDDAVDGGQLHRSERPAHRHHPHDRGHGQRGRALGRRHARGDRAQDRHLQPAPARQGRAPRSRAHALDARARHRRHGLRRAHPLPRGVLLARRPSDGRRHRPRRPRALRGDTSRAPSSTATTSRRAAA